MWTKVSASVRSSRATTPSHSPQRHRQQQDTSTVGAKPHCETMLERFNDLHPT
ncbi:MAG: hypothetical protein WAX17_06860 [Psychrobacter urativorans]